jgi:hypothetical protein
MLLRLAESLRPNVGESGAAGLLVLLGRKTGIYSCGLTDEEDAFLPAKPRKCSTITVPFRSAAAKLHERNAVLRHEALQPAPRSPG